MAYNALQLSVSLYYYGFFNYPPLIRFLLLHYDAPTRKRIMSELEMTLTQT